MVPHRLNHTSLCLQVFSHLPAKRESMGEKKLRGGPHGFRWVFLSRSPMAAGAGVALPTTGARREFVSREGLGQRSGLP